jgi:starch synthase
MFLMPSRFEPCGLNQMYSLKYGTIPIVRAAGGLDDTIENFDRTTGRGNGFKFYDYDAARLLEKIYEALLVYADPNLWRKLISDAMNADFSWDRSARQYVEVYEKLAQHRAAARV